MRRKAFSYIRMSTEAQLKGNSLARQLALTKEYAMQMNLDLIEDLRDIGLSAHSGKNIKSGQLGQFLNALDNDKIEKGSVLIVESFDRLSRRDPMEAFTLLSSIIKKGIEVHTISDLGIYNSENMKSDVGKLFTSLGVMFRAHSESEEKSRRLKKAWEGKRAKLETHILTRKCPAWLKPKKDGSGFDIDPYATSIVKMVFDLCINQNMGAFAIAKHLNQNIEKYPKFTKSEIKNRLVTGKDRLGWHKSYIMKILNNKAVYGEFQPQELKDGKPTPIADVYENYFPAVISKVDFHRAQSSLKRRALAGGGRKGTVFTNIFTKLLVCGYCSAAIHYLNKGDRPKGGVYLRCSNAVSGYRCNCTSWDYKNFEKVFFDYIKQVDFSDVFNSPQSITTQKLLVVEKEELEAELLAAEDKLNRAFNMQLNLSETAKKRTNASIQNISNEMDKIEQRLEIVSDALSKIKFPDYNLTKKSLISFLNNKNADAENCAEIRKKINATISKTVNEIKLYSQANGSGIFPWEHESLPDRTINAFKKMDIVGEQLEDFLDTIGGQTMLNEMERYFVIKFKNDAEQTVRPYYDISSEIDYSSFTKFKKAVMKRREERELIKLKSQRNVKKTKKS